MNTFCGFDLDRVPALKKALADLPATAGNQSRAVATTVNNANAAVARGYGTTLPGRDNRSFPIDADRLGFQAPTTDAASVAADVGRRLTHLLACQKLENDGYTIDRTRVFDDEPAPSEEKIKAALAQAKTVTDDDSYGGNRGSVDDLVKQFSGLTAAEAEAVVAKLPDSDLKALNKALTENTYFGAPEGPMIENGLDNDGRIKLSNALFPKLSADQLHRFSTIMTSLQPDLGGTDESGDKIVHGVHYQWANGQLFVDGKAVPSDIDQGDLGDCWFLAGLGAEQQVNPKFAQQHIRDNGNGTYTVTLYKDGKAYPVTVDGQLPYNDGNPPGTSFDHDPGNGAMWVQIYEKAYAQYRGGYAKIEGGWGDTSMHDLTGKHASRVDPDDTSFDDIEKKLKSGVPVTVNTDSHHSGFLWHHSDETFDGGKLVTKHVYIVQSVDNSAHPPTVTLRNPWGGDENSTPPGVVTLTQDEFNSHMTDVSFGD